MLRAVERKRVTAAEWAHLLKTTHDESPYVLEQPKCFQKKQSVNTLVMSLDGHFAVAFGSRFPHHPTIHVLWVAYTASLKLGSARWLMLLRHAARLVSPSIRAVHISAPLDTVRVLHKAGFRVAKSTQRGVVWREPETVRREMTRLPRTPRSTKELPGITDIDGLLFLDQLVKHKLMKEVEDGVPMFVRV